MTTEQESLPRKFHHEITTADTFALARRFMRFAGAQAQHLPQVTSFDVEPERSCVRFTPGESYSTSTVRNVASWAVQMQVPLVIGLSESRTVTATKRIDDGQRATDGHDPDGRFDIIAQLYLNSGVGRLLAWLVRDHQHDSGDDHTCPHCGHGGGVSLATVPDGGQFECDPGVLCIAWDNAYAEYKRMPSAGEWTNLDRAVAEGTRKAILGALFYEPFTKEKHADIRARRAARSSG